MRILKRSLRLIPVCHKDGTQLWGGWQLVTEMRYDAEGNLVGFTDPKAQAFAIAYDELSRETLRTLPDQASEFITTLSIETFYDANSNVTRVVEYKRGDVDGGTSSTLFTDETTRTYDLFDREIGNAQRGRTIECAYDDNGNRTRVASTGGSTGYEFDYRNRIKTATLNSDEPTTYTYLKNNWLARVAYPNGTEIATDYDRVGRLQTLVEGGN